MKNCITMSKPILNWVFITSILNLILRSDGECPGGVSRCQWTPWESWNSCSRTCGGGTQKRIRYFCCKLSLVNDIRACMADCGMNYDDYSQYFSDYRNCNQYCYNGGSFVSGSCRCPDTFYDTCCSQECPQIEFCKRRYCTNSWNSRCRECFDDNTFFKRTYSDTRCERMCAWNNHYCWPGECAENLKRGCRCAPGFKKIDTPSETSCQPTQKPSILTCDTALLIPGGEKKLAKSKGNSTACQYLEDMYGNFQPSVLQFDIMSEYNIDLSNYSRPNFIHESYFGITDLAINLSRQELNGTTKGLSTKQLLTDTNSSVEAIQTFNISGNISMSPPTYALHDGQALCFQFEVHAGGYFKGRNTVTQLVSSAIPYLKVTTTKDICYRFDNEPPQHCKATGTCNEEPLQLQHRITRSPFQPITFTGWTDPIPAGGKIVHASAIESYLVTVNEVLPSHEGLLKVDTKVLFTETFNHTENGTILNLTSDIPRLFSITLEVKDAADNLRRARRFVLFDNTSIIATRAEKPFRITTASSQTNYTWQTHHYEICLDWKDHFLNQFYLENKLLNPIEPDPNGLIAGVYEQLSGDIPVSGTPNVNGIIKFMLSWKLDAGNFFDDILFSDPLNQSYCKNLNFSDGQTYTFKLRVKDVANNTFEEETKVSIDLSVPIVHNMSLTQDGHRSNFVQRRTDLSTFQFSFEAKDVHSGLRTVEWTFSEKESGLDITSGILATVTTKACLRRTDVCYCPKVGACEFFNYIVPLDYLATNYKRKGYYMYNTSYYFTVKVTNNAMLSSMAQEEFVVNNSPPETDKYRAVPVIVGGTIGGLTVVIAIALTTFFIMRRKRTEKQSQQTGTERTAVGSTSVNIWITLDAFRPSNILQKVIDLRSRNAQNTYESAENQNEYEVFEEINLKRFKTKHGKMKSNVTQERKDSEEAAYSTIKEEMTAQDYNVYDDLQPVGRRGDDPDYINLKIVNGS